MSRALALSTALLAACAHAGGSGAGLPEGLEDRRVEAVLAGGAGRAVLAVLPFDAGTGPAANGSRPELRIADLVTAGLARSGRVVLVERERMDKVFDEQRLKASGAVDDASRAAEVGQLLGAEAVVAGAISSATQETQDRFAYDLVRTEVRIDARAIDTTSGRLIVTESGSGVALAKVIRSADGTLISGLKDPKDEFRKAAVVAAEELSRRLAHRFAVLGVVVKVSAAQVVCDLGRSHGLEVGDELVALRPGQRLVHPITKALLGVEKQVLGRLRALQVETASAVLEPLDGAQLRPGDLVVLGAGRAP